MSKTTQKTGVIAAIRIGRKGSAIVLTNGQSVPVSEGLLLSLAKSTGFATVSQLCMNAPTATINYTLKECKAGETIGLNAKGQQIVNKEGSTVYIVDHNRYENISIVLSQNALMSANIAASIGESMAKMFGNIVAPQAALEQKPAEKTVEDETIIVNDPIIIDENIVVENTPVMEETTN